MDINNEGNSKETLPCSRVSRIIQIHPSLNCNLKCKHCYSSSAPGLKDGLDVGLLMHILEQASAIGYNVISMSGGEPFLYKSIEELTRQSKSIGYFNSVTSNGMLFETSNARNTFKYLDLVAISIDGKEDFHDTMRSHKGAFKKMVQGIEILKDEIKNYGFIHTLLPGSWKLLPWLAEFAMDHKAGLLHLHPLEMSGRANLNFNEIQFTSNDLHKIYIACHYLKTYYGNDLFIQLDLLHKDNIIDNPNFLFHQSFQPEFTCESFSSIFKELIIDDKGDIFPIAYGCSEFFKIGNIASSRKLSEMIELFMVEKMDYMMRLFNDTYFEIVNNKEYEIFNWSERIIANSRFFDNEKDYTEMNNLEGSYSIKDNEGLMY